MKTSAIFGPGGEHSQYRYALRRDWTDEVGLFTAVHQGAVLFLMLNPSTADATKDDPTVAKCVRLARRWGFSALEVRNIFAFRSTDPWALRKAADPVGPMNNAAIAEAVLHPETRLIVAAWGVHGTYLERGAEVRDLLLRAGKPVQCFLVMGPLAPLTQQGQPAHPLYQPECGMGGLARYL